jgi:hypothetical protein
MIFRTQTIRDTTISRTALNPISLDRETILNWHSIVKKKN